ncbi:MAG: YaiI/YqxD family protein [Candidatus Eisenbacteria bacterium]|nr:YaiI/YqxD family protein [Candidatus Eisenbacteria bacterium]
MKLWIDADAMPREVKDVIFRAAKRIGLQTILVANQGMPLPAASPMVTSVLVEGGADVADQYIVDHAEAADIAITADIPLAALLVGRGLAVIDPRGREYTPENVGEILSSRDLMYDLRGAGQITGGPPSFHSRDRQAFANALDRVLTRRLGQAPGPGASD